MSSTIDHAKKLNTLLRSLRSAGDVDAFPKRDPLDELVYSLLLWEAPRSKAEAGFKRLMASVVDHNELRVTRAEEIADVLGIGRQAVKRRIVAIREKLQAVA